MRDQHDGRGRAEPPRLSHPVPSAADRVAEAGEVAGADLLRADAGAHAQPRPDARAEFRRGDHGRSRPGRTRLQGNTLDLDPALAVGPLALEGCNLAHEALSCCDLQPVVVPSRLAELQTRRDTDVGTCREA